MRVVIDVPGISVKKEEIKDLSIDVTTGSLSNSQIISCQIPKPKLEENDDPPIELWPHDCRRLHKEEEEKKEAIDKKKEDNSENFISFKSHPIPKSMFALNIEQIDEEKHIIDSKNGQIFIDLLPGVVYINRK